MNRLLPCVFLLASSLVFAGCGDDSGNNDSGGGSNSSNAGSNDDSGSNGESNGNNESNSNNESNEDPAPSTGSNAGVVGVWELDFDKTIEATPALTASIPEAQREQALGMMRQAMGQMNIEFRADGTASMTSTGPSQNATYSVSGNQINVVPEDDDDSGPESVTFTENEIIMEGTENGQAMKMIFRRKTN